jgi:hypothetical protein
MGQPDLAKTGAFGPAGRFSPFISGMPQRVGRDGIGSRDGTGIRDEIGIEERAPGRSPSGRRRAGAGASWLVPERAGWCRRELAGAGERG